MYFLDTHPGFINEITFTAIRSSGPGGQNVNKVSSKIELRFNILKSGILTASEKDLLTIRLANKMSNEGFLIITSQESRSQIDNREIALNKFFNLLNVSLKSPKKRRPTKPSLSAKQKRLSGKKIISEKKSSRNFKPDY